MCWEGSEVLPIEKLSNTVNLPEHQMQSYADKVVTLVNPTIATVYKVETFYKCLRCSSTDPSSETETRCCNAQCGILNNKTFCEKFSSLEILVIYGTAKERVVLTCVGDKIIAHLLGSNETPVTEEAIIRAPPIISLLHRNDKI